MSNLAKMEYSNNIEGMMQLLDIVKKVKYIELYIKLW